LLLLDEFVVKELSLEFTMEYALDGKGITERAGFCGTERVTIKFK
jgi:hypothetical protein